MDYLAAWMFLALTILLMAGFPVTFTLLGTALTFGMIGFGWDFFNLLPLRIWGRMTNVTLAAVPLFVFMGVMLERSGLAEELLDTMGLLFGRLKGGLAISVVVVGMLLGASTGIVGATVVTMGLLAVPTMLRRGYQKELATGTVSASGTLGQIIPPSIVLVLIADIVGVSVGDVFMGAVLPGLLLVGLFIIYILIAAYLRSGVAPAISKEELAAISPKQLAVRVGKALVPPLFLIVAVLGSIFAGIASPTEAAAVGAVGATALTIANKKLNRATLHEVMHTTTRLTCMVFVILCVAAAFGLVFRGRAGNSDCHPCRACRVAGLRDRRDRRRLPGARPARARRDGGRLSRRAGAPAPRGRAEADRPDRTARTGPCPAKPENPADRRPDQRRRD